MPTTTVSSPQWPPYVEAWIDEKEALVHIKISYGALSQKIVLPRGEAYTRTTLRICNIIYYDLRAKQALIDKTTQRLFS